MIHEWSYLSSCKRLSRTRSERFPEQMMNFALTMMKFVLKMKDFAFQTMNRKVAKAMRAAMAAEGDDDGQKLHAEASEL